MRTLVALTLVAAACGGSTAKAPPAPAPAPTEAAPAAQEVAPPGLRLPRTVLPTSNKVRLSIDPAKETFSGTIEITARASEPTRLFWLHAEHLKITSASAAAGGKTFPLEVVTPQTMTAGFRSAEPIPAGELVVSLAFDGKLDDKETDGIFRQKEHDDWYAFTQFESVMARRAFPCFDEPDNKVPWQLTLDVPEKLLAVSNTPVVSEKPDGHGGKTVEFGPTRPLPSYLVAFAVGPFEAVDAGKTRGGAAFRVLVSRGRGGDVGYVVENTPKILELLEDYFGTPYPYAKLDLLAVPVTASFGAMENPGLVTFNQALLVARKEDFTIGFQRNYTSVTAHELAHQWFGDLVTLAWWDDIWLNESFAEWMGDKVTQRYKPEWRGDVVAVSSKSGVMGQDALQTARKIRQPIETEDDIHNTADAITYEKGAAVIAMFERWVGEEKFRDGVRLYLKTNADKNATAKEFMSAVGQAAARDVGTPFSTFLDQAGAPLVSFDLGCKPGEAPRLALAQERYIPKGSEGDANQTWQVPICVKLGTSKGIVSRCTLLAAKTQEWKLDDVAECPQWILPNDGGTGYYRSQLGGPLLGALLKALDKLTLPETMEVIGDVDALVAAGKVDVGMAMAFVPRFAGHRDHHLVASAAGIAGRAKEIIPSSVRPSYKRFVLKMFGARARSLGWKSKAGEDDEVRLLRKTVVPLVAEDGEDKALAKEARALALAWIADHGAVDPDMVAPVLGTAAYSGDEKLFEKYLAAAKAATDRHDRQRLLGALSGFRDTALVGRAMGLAVSGDFDPREAIGMFFGGLQNPATRRQVYEQVKLKYDQLVEKLPKPFTPYLVYAGVAQCDASLQPEVEAFFKERTTKEPGGPRIYEQAMEAMAICIKQREAQRPGITAFLKKY